MFEEARRKGGKEGALFLHTRPPATFWGISFGQVKEFIAKVEKAIRDGRLINFNPAHLPQYPQERFKEAGPTVHQVNDQLVKPLTDSMAQPLPYASYALLQNPHHGCACGVFASHAWDEGVREFWKSLSRAWPTSCHGAYICFLANPQNLDISALVGSPRQSPFYRALEAFPQEMLMIANSNAPIHSRLWCVYEAHCARELHIPVRIAGDPLWLLAPSDRDFAKKVTLECLGATGPSRSSGRKFEAELSALALDVNKASCFSEEDKKLIWNDIGGKADIINIMIKEQIVALVGSLADVN